MILAFLAALAASPQAESPRQFVARVYASYAREDYSPLARPDRVFAAALVREIREDQRLAKGEVGYLDGDPLCDCQDYLKLTAHIRGLRQPDGRKASARVHVTLGVDGARDLRLELTRTGAGWRIADVVSPGRSLLKALQRSNRRR